MKHALVISLFLSLCATARADHHKGVKTDSDHAKAINLSLIPDVAIFKRTEKIRGFTLSIWGENEQTGFALGFVNGFRGESAGLGFGLVNYGDSYTGVNLAAVNWMKKDFLGFQAGFVNYVAGTAKGLQWAAVNYVGELNGVQLGIVNYAVKAKWALQIGLANIIASNQQWFGAFPKEVAPAMILANWSFN